MEAKYYLVCLNNIIKTAVDQTFILGHVYPQQLKSWRGPRP